MTEKKFFRGDTYKFVIANRREIGTYLCFCFRLLLLPSSSYRAITRCSKLESLSVFSIEGAIGRGCAPLVKVSVIQQKKALCAVVQKNSFFACLAEKSCEGKKGHPFVRSCSSRLYCSKSGPFLALKATIPREQPPPRAAALSRTPM